MADTSDAERTYRPASPTSSADKAALAQAYDALRSGRMDDARRLADQLLRSHPDAPAVLMLAGELEFADGDLRASLNLVERAIAFAGDDAGLLMRKAHLLLLLGERIAARLFAIRAAELTPVTGQTLWQAASIHVSANDPARAVELYRNALAYAGESPPLLYALASTEFFTGAFDEAEAHLDRLLAIAPQFGHALYLRATLRRQSHGRNHIDDLKARSQRGFPDRVSHAACLYALAKEYEDLGEDDRAFEALTEGARTMRSTLTYDIDAECRTIADVRTTIDAPSLARAATGCSDDGAIFIVGMPRSGTTLVERILSGHDAPAPAGELLDFGNALASSVQLVRTAKPDLGAAQAALEVNFATLGTRYMWTARQAADGSHQFVDKMPVNYLYCGLIQQALPNARIIHLARDPLDTCFAVYKTLFYNAYHFSYDLAELAKYYVAYHETMRHWHRVMPNRILDVRYEDMVTSPLDSAARIRAWCGLSADSSSVDDADRVSGRPFATASAAQVREPVHTRSIHKSRRHLAGLAPAIAILKDAGIRVD